MAEVSFVKLHSGECHWTLLIQSTLVQVMAWCRQATSHYLSQCWPRFMSPCGVTRPQCVKMLSLDTCYGLSSMTLLVKLLSECHRIPDHKPILAQVMTRGCPATIHSLPESIFTHIYVSIWRKWATMSYLIGDIFDPKFSDANDH